MIETQVEQKVQVEKRDGRVTDFDPTNIINAVKAAYGDIDKPYGPQEEQTARELAARVEAELKDRYNGPAKIEDVQTLVEQSLVSSHLYDVAKAYTEYRLNRDIERAKSTDINYAVKRLVDRDESIVKENANKDSNVYSTQRDLLAGAVSKATAFQMLPKAVANAHMKGDIHFHDADYSPFTAQTNCLARETRFVTDRGVRSFKDYEDGDTVNALAPSGTFRRSVVRSYGMRKLDEITLSNGRTERKVQATGNHRWLLRDGRVTTTLQVGDQLEQPPTHSNVLVTNPTGRVLRAWVQGFAYDRGVTFEWPDTDVCSVRLADYEREYAHAFDNLGYKAFSVNDDGVEYHLNSDDMAFDLDHMSVEELNAFCEGFMASMNASDIIVTNGKDDSFRIIEQYLPIAGYHIQSKRDKIGPDGTTLREYHLYDNDADLWTVTRIEREVRGQQVWCLEVPDEHAFVLEGGIVTGNCSLPNYWDMLANGFTLGNAPMGSPNSISIAATQITQIMKDVAASQYGGQTANRADEHLAEYAKKDYAKFLEQAKEIMPDDLPVEIAERQVAGAKKTEPQRLHFEKDRPALPMDEPFHKDADRLQQLREIWAKIQTRKAIYDAMQTMEYQINSNRVSNGQTPFVTVGLGLGTDWFAREIQRAIFLNRIRGLGSEHRTAIFPKLIFTIKHGMNADPDDPNYDMKQLALECATKRMYPDVIFYENIIKITGSYKNPMGAVAGYETVTWQDGDGLHLGSIRQMWDRLARRHEPKWQHTNGDDWYIDLPDGEVSIRDSHDGVARMVGVRRIISNQGRRLLRVTFTGGRVVDCTEDHPFEVEGRGRIRADQLNNGDVIRRSVETRPDMGCDAYRPDMAWLMGVIICDGCLNEGSETVICHALHGEDEISDKIKAMYGADRLRETTLSRGSKGDYRQITIKDKDLRNDCISRFGGMVKNDRSVPACLLDASREERVAFLGGVVDADGHIRDGIVQVGSTNKTLAMGEMLVAESLGYKTAVYANHYQGSSNPKVRYQVTFHATSELLEWVQCAKKRNGGVSDTKADMEETVSVAKVEELEGGRGIRVYDVTTASDYFDVSGVSSHNCRSFLQGWTDPKTGEDVEDGRMNLGVVTVNIPRIALESRGDKKRFWRLFGERMRVAHQALQFRINRCKQAMPINAPTLFRYGAFGRLSASDNVDQLFRDERATVSLGYIGLYEATSVFYGKDWMRDHSWDPEGKEFALEIVKRMNRLCRKWSKEEGYHYSVYSTPAESLTDRFNRMDREKFGRVEGVTDHDFYTNSFHYPVWLSPTPFEKLDYEKDFPYYASGGFINYCEFPCLQANPKALEAVWDYAYQIGIGYLGTNTPIDTCYVCGYQGDFEPTEEGFKCPECGNSDPDKCNVTKRTCGYLGNPVQRPMVHGRHEEIAHRVKHMGGETGHVTLQDGSEREWFEDEGKTFTTVER